VRHPKHGALDLRRQRPAAIDLHRQSEARLAVAVDEAVERRHARGRADLLDCRLGDLLAVKFTP
jgi:hypothetical protein